MVQRILVVEDDDELSTLLRLMFKLADWQICRAADGYEALEYASDFKPTLVLLDIMLPGMDGVEVCRRLRETPDMANVPIVVLSAKTDPETRKAAEAAGALEYWTKPIVPQVFLTNLRRVLKVED